MFAINQIALKNYLSLIKFSHTIFALPFALIGFTLAVSQDTYNFSWNKLLFVLLCMIFARSAAMAFNRYIDRDVDRANPRTAEIREIPNGTIKAKSAFIFVLINCFLFIPYCITCYSRLQLHQTLYSIVSSDIGSWSLTISNWSLSCGYSPIWCTPYFILLYCIILGKWFRYYLCTTRRKLW